MRRLSILAHDRDTGHKLSRWMGELCAGEGILPRTDAPENLEGYFYTVLKDPPDGVVVALPGVAGLNAMEHLRRLCPDCAVIWCSDLDFSLQAYRLNVEYFFLGVPSREELAEGFSRWLDRYGRRANARNEVAL